jgi:hypothetical protein
MKHIILFPVLIIAAVTASAQWENEGTRYTSSPNLANHVSQLSATSNGGAYMIWETDSQAAVVDTFGGSWLTLQAITDSGRVRAGWPAGGIRLIAPNAYSGGPRVITSQDGGAIVSWHSNAVNPQISQIWVQKFDSTGVPQWNGGQPLQVSLSDGNYNIYPVIASDGRNGVYVAWTQFFNLGYPGNKVLMQHITSLGERDILWKPEGAQAIQLDTPQNYPQISVTSDNAVYIAFEMGYIANQYGNNEQLVLNKINGADGAVANGWPLNGVILTAPTLLDVWPYYGLNLFTDNQNNAMLFWQQESSGGYNDAMYMQLVSPGAENLLPPSGYYPPSGVHLFSDNVYQYPVEDGGGGTGAIYMNATYDTGSNAYFVAFNVIPPDAGSYDLSLINVDAFGNIVWQDTLLTNNGISGYPRLTPDGKGGVFVFYDSLDNAEYYLNAIGVNRSGHIDSAWTPYGPTFGSIDIDDVSSPVVDLDAVYTRPGEAMVTWQRLSLIPTDSSLDIYACNLLSTGQTCTVNPAYPDTAKTDTTPLAINPVSGALESLRVSPNPFNSETFVNFSTSGDYHELLFKIYNLSGELVQENKIAALSNNTILTDALANGLYLYQLVGDNAVLRNGKLVKQ